MSTENVVTGPGRLRMAAFLVLAASGLVACVSRDDDYARQCIAELDLPGNYEYTPGTLAPVVRPGAGGTVRGAEILNQCVRRKAELNEPGQPAPVVTAPAATEAGLGGATFVAVTGEGNTRRADAPIYPAAPARPEPVYTATPVTPPFEAATPQYVQRPACRPRQRGVTQAPLFC
ncbi:hypothetical protein R5H30_13840 [Sulfitobacter sp. D35]|uniref:hypothetical protein n=1 Tax=Sulfitobacter sp. D35 TaxID=3083252 RepID=UPI00296E4AA3|nr:hypothetical protein [Sulfitobacter sp. D35]MDW4499073.1 hypothetical protein [Sulfitobacter sp. D35]